jgi:hypothetical protein
VSELRLYIDGVLLVRLVRLHGRVSVQFVVDDYREMVEGWLGAGLLEWVETAAGTGPRVTTADHPAFFEHIQRYVHRRFPYHLAIRREQASSASTASGAALLGSSG